MITSFTQTYGDNRQLLFDSLVNDEYTQYVLNNCDNIIYSFHNCPNIFIDHNLSILKNIFKDKLIALMYNDISYTNTIKLMLDYLKDLGTTKLLFNQDDSFCIKQDKIIIDELFTIIRNFDFPMLSLEYSSKEINIINKKNKQLNLINIYKTNSNDFINAGKWSFDDSCYVADVKYLNSIYDEIYFNIGDVWRSEQYLNYKHSTNTIHRYVTNMNFFKRFNVVGMNVNKKDKNNLDKLLKGKFKNE